MDDVKSNNNIIPTSTNDIDILSETVEIRDFSDENAKYYFSNPNRKNNWKKNIISIGSDLANPDFLSKSNKVATRIAGIVFFHGLHFIAFMVGTFSIAMRLYIKKTTINYVFLVINFVTNLIIYEYLRSLNPGILFPSYDQQKKYNNGPFITEDTGYHRVYMKNKKLYLYPSDSTVTIDGNSDKYVLLDSRYCKFCKSFMPLRSKHEHDQLNYYPRNILQRIRKKIELVQKNRFNKELNGSEHILNKLNNGLGGSDKDGYCIANFDHYCAWIGTSVGQGNRFMFTMFLISESILLIHYLIYAFSGIGYYREKLKGNITFNPRNPSGLKEKYPLSLAMNENIGLTIMLLTFIFFIPFVFSLAAYHLFLIFANSTTYEGLKEDKLFYLIHQKKVVTPSKRPKRNEMMNDFFTYGPYDDGSINNFISAFKKYKKLNYVKTAFEYEAVMENALDIVGYNEVLVTLNPSDKIYHEFYDENDIDEQKEFESENKV